MHFVVSVAIPVLVIFMTLVVGLALDTTDFSRILKVPLLATAVLRQASAHNAMTSETPLGG